MRRLLCGLLVSLILFASSCQTNHEEQQDQTPSDVNIEEMSGDGKGANYDDSNKEKLSAFNKTATIEEGVIYDENNVKITAVSLEYGTDRVILNLLFENNDVEDLTFVSGSVGYCCNSVNGYMTSAGYLNCDVSAGKKANDTISFEYNELMKLGVFGISDIEVAFDIHDSEYNDIYTGPLQVKTTRYNADHYSENNYQKTIVSVAAENTFRYDLMYFSDEILYDKAGIRVISSALVNGKNNQYILYLEVENNNDELVKIYTNNIRVNGLGIGSSIWGEHDMITPGKRAVVKLDLQSALPLEYWTVFGMTEIANVSFDITQKDFESDVVVDAVGVGIDVSDKMIGFDKSGENLYNKNGLNVILKEIVMESADGGDVFIFLLAENNSDNVLQIDDVYDSLSVNDFMMRYSCYGVDIGVGEWHILKIRLEEDDLAEIGIASLEQITNIEFSISIRDDGHKKIDEPTIAINK